MRANSASPTVASGKAATHTTWLYASMASDHGGRHCKQHGELCAVCVRQLAIQRLGGWDHGGNIAQMETCCKKNIVAIEI